MKIALAIVLLATLGVHGEILDGELVQKQLEAHNKFFQDSGLQTLPLPGAKTGGLLFSPGTQHHLDTMVPTGDSEKIIEDNKIKYKYRIGFNNLTFAFDKIVFENEKTLEKPELTVKGGNSLRFDFSLKLKPNCVISLDDYAYDKMEGIEGKAKNDLTKEELDQIRGVLLEHINTVLDLKKDEIVAGLEETCNPPDWWPRA